MFNDIIGNNKIKNYLIASIANNKISHSYMFVGVSGIGKKLIALEFSKKILCLESKDEECKCKSCIEFDTQNHPDFELVEAEGNTIGINQIRDLQRKIQEKPIISNKKIYIIDNAEKMTVEAQNCLLKTLEEPPKFAIIILIGSNESLFLDTIKSRCLILHFEQLGSNEISQYLSQNYGMQNLDNEIVKIFQGSIGKAIELKDKIEQYKQIGEMLKKINQLDYLDVVNLAKPIYEAKEDIYSILEYMNVILLELSKENYKYTKCVQIVENTKERLKCNSNYDMSIDNMLFNMWREVN